MTNVCKHGQLARSCEICELEGRLAEIVIAARAVTRWDWSDNDADCVRDVDTLRAVVELAERDNSVMDGVMAERDAAVKFIHVIGEELILRGYPGGDRDVILANIRMIPQRDP